MTFKEKNGKRFTILLAIVTFVLGLLVPGNISAANWPEKGKILTKYIPYGAGGGGDIVGRTLQPFMEAEFGIKMVIINKAGGGSQVGTTEYLSKAGTDGYTIIQSVLAGFPAVYLDPDRKATYGRKDLQLVANVTSNPIGIAVKKGRYRSLKDLIEDARANPGKIRITSSGPMSTADMAIFALEKAAGVKFGHMFYDQQGEQRAALLGEHVAAECNPVQEQVPGHRSGEVEVLAITDDRISKSLPDVKTAEMLGYKAYMHSSTGLIYKAGTPREIVDRVATAMKRIESNPEFQKQFERIGVAVRIMVGKEYENFWSQVESTVASILQELKTRK